MSLFQNKLRRASQYLPVHHEHRGSQHHNEMFFQAGAESFVFNIGKTAETIAHFDTRDAAPIKVLADLDVDFVLTKIADVGATNDRLVIRPQRASVSQGDMDIYKTMKFELFAYMPAVTRPYIPIGYRHVMYEPFFSFGSATGLFPCKRPLDQQKESFPLAIQDYTISFNRRTDRGIFEQEIPFYREYTVNLLIPGRTF